MKLLLLIAVVFSSCHMTAYVGMDERDFVKKNKSMGVELIESNVDRNVYRWCRSECYFYYFANGTMYQLDNGEPNPSLMIYRY